MGREYPGLQDFQSSLNLCHNLEGNHVAIVVLKKQATSGCEDGAPQISALNSGMDNSQKRMILFDLKIHAGPMLQRILKQSLLIYICLVAASVTHQT